MPDITSEEKNIKKLQRLFNLMDDDALTREDFIKYFEMVIKIIKDLKETNAKEFELIRRTVEMLSKKLKEENSVSLSDVKKQVSDTVGKALKEQADSLNFIRDKARSIKSGKDADEAKMIQSVLNQIKLPEQKDTILDTPIQIRDKLETLQDEERLDWNAVRGVVGIHIGTNPPKDKDMLWIDINA